jgi:hypothetical protein
MGFDAPLSGEILTCEAGEWVRVVVAEQRDGFVIRDRRRGRADFSQTGAPWTPAPCFSLPPGDPERFSRGGDVP